MVPFGDADASGGDFEGFRHKSKDALVGHVGFGLLTHRHFESQIRRLNLRILMRNNYLLDTLILRTRLDPHFDMHASSI